MNKNSELHREPLAIIGMGCRFPGGASSPAAFWELLANGTDAIIEVPKDRWNIERFYDPDPEMPGKMYMRAGGFLKERIDQFDAMFFGMSPREAASLDPQQRMLLEVAWEAMEDAGLPVDRLAGADVGVYVGALTLDNMLTQLHPLNRDRIGVHTAVSTMMTMLSNRLSYAFDFRGPSISMDTACSSSLVALHEASQAIWNGECSMALVGGVNIMHRPEYLMVLCKGGFVAADGRSKSFDERADGYGRGEGAGIVVVKPYADAKRDGDRIYALIRATGVNQDGRTDGITVPNPVAQEALIRRVCAQAQLEPSAISYIEAHGTGTAVGDPIETSALAGAIGKHRAPGNPVTIGSVKANIGHLEAAAGIASVIKSALCLKHKQIPPVANLGTPNPKILFKEWGLRLPSGLEPMPVSGHPAYVGINSFGYGGTNAHAIFEEAPQLHRRTPVPDAQDSGLYFLPISARSGAALNALVKSYGERLDAPEAPRLHDVCYSAALRRAHHDQRLALVADSREAMREQLQAFAERGQSKAVITGSSFAKGQKPVWVFTGMGPQWWAMARELLNQEPVFRRTAEECDAIFRKLSEWRILDEMMADESNSRMSVAHISACANFIVQVSLAALWRSWGVEPGAIVGHSLGEIAAAHVAGVLNLEDAIRVLYHRSRLLNKIAGQGAMMAVGFSEHDAVPYLAAHKDKVTIAAVNSPSAITFAGDKAALEQIAAQLQEQGVFNRFLQVEMAYHSPYMEPLREEVYSSLHDVEARELACPIYSSVTGKREDGVTFDTGYWWRNMRQPVYFAHAIDALIQDGFRVFLEIGPHPVLSTSIKQCLAHRGEQGISVASMRRDKPERATMLEGLAGLYVSGCPIDWDRYYSQGGTYVSLPSYPWQRETYWHEAEDAQAERIGMPTHALLGRRVPAPTPAWESRLNRNLLPYLPDHKVQGLEVLAGASYAELGLAIHHELTGQSQSVLEDLEFHKALVIDKSDEPVLHVTYDESTRAYAVYSRQRDGSTWDLHARGRLSLVAPSAAAPVLLTQIQARCTELIEGAVHYQSMSDRGLDYGPYFQGVRHLWRDASGEEILAWVEGHEQLADAAHGNRLHPTVFDSSLQTLLTTLGAKGDNEVYIPVGMRRLKLHSVPKNGFWCHGKLKHKWEGLAEGDIILFDADGNVIVEALGVRAQALTRQARDELKQIDQWLYQFAWEPAALDAAPVNARRWLLFMDRDGAGDKLAEQLRAAGVEEIVRVQPAETFEQLSPTHYLVGTDNPADMHRLVKEVTALGVDGIAYLWGLDTPTDQHGLVGGASKMVPAVHLVQALGQARLSNPPRLVLVTRHAQSARRGDMSDAVTQAPLIGLARVAINEYPDLRLRAIDIDRSAEALSQLARELLADSPEDEIALRGTERYAHRMTRRRAQELTAESGKASVADAASNAAADNLAYQPRRKPGVSEVEIALQSATLEREGIAVSAAIGFMVARDGLGAVARLDETLADLQPGDEVLVHLSGNLGPHVTLPATHVYPLPQRDATLIKSHVAYLPAFLRAYYALHHVAHLQPGESVFIQEAASAFGLAAIQVARWCGAEVYVAAAMPAQRDYLGTLGVTHVYDSQSLDFADHVLDDTAGRGVDVVLNVWSGEFAGKMPMLVAPFGRLVDVTAGEASLALHRRPPANRSVTVIDFSELLLGRRALYGRLLAEVCERFRAKDFVALPTQDYTAAEVTNALEAVNAGARIGAVTVSFAETAAATESTSLFQADGTYLITGGFGGFGLEIASWMVELGARHLVLVGRRGAHTPEAQQAVDRLRERGAQVLPAAADVSQESDVARLLAQVAKEMPPLKGVFHTAAVLNDGPINQVNREQVEDVMRPKSLGAWHLHCYTQAAPLDYFVLFSSVACMVGGPGQASYAMSCAYLDALARYRRARNLPATSINWGALGEVGMVARYGEVAKYFSRTGVGSFTPSQAVKLLGRALEWNPIELGVAIMDWKLWGGTYPTWAASPKYAPLAATADDAGAEAGDRELVRTLIGMKPEERQAAVADIVVGLLAQTLRLAPEKVDRGQSLLNMGIDSLMAMELQTSVENSLGVKVSTLELMKGNNLTQLAQNLAKSIGAPKPAKPAAPAKPAPQPLSMELQLQDAGQMVAKVGELSDEEVAQLVETLTRPEGAQA
jgi:acyl transferase domain-containing protein/acyl carrier protein